jgi:stringent starvation protein B
MPVPIPDLRVDEEGVFGTLSFKGVPFTCFVPWRSVFALVGEDGKGMVWSAEMPPEVAGELQRDARVGFVPGGPLVDLQAFRARREAKRPSQPPKRSKSERPPSWDRPSYLRVVK